MLDLNQVHERLIAQQDAMVEELGRYVTVETGSYDKEGIDRAGELVTAAFAELGFTIERIRQERLGDHFIARKTGSGKGRLLGSIHLDTVWPAGSLADNPFRVEGDRAYGPGTMDMKGGWVVLLAALRGLRDAGWDGLASTTVFITGDEELGSTTARQYIEKEARDADWVVVMEPARDDGNLVIGRTVIGAIYLEITGIAAHTARMTEGASAITELAHKVLELEALSDPERGIKISVGTIQAGSARQTIPDRAKADVDLRAPDDATAAELLAKIEEIVGRTHVEGTTTKMSGGITRPEFPTSDGTRWMLEQAKAAARELEMEVDGVIARGGSDGSFTASVGTPTLDGLGPEGAGSITREEYVYIPSLAQRGALLAGIISRLPEQLKEK